MAFSKRMRERADREQAVRDAKEKAERDAEKARAEQYERKLIREIAEQDAQADRLADPPPELSPTEAREREGAERLTRLEQDRQKEQDEKRFAREPHAFRVDADQQRRQQRLREDLRLLRNRLEAERQDKRTEEHVKRCGRQIKALEAQVSDIESQQQAEKERHRQAMGELNAEHARAAAKLGDLLRTLAPEETSDERLGAVMG